jgi:hypothetical protein
MEIKERYNKKTSLRLGAKREAIVTAKKNKGGLVFVVIHSFGAD